ncbi:hypothetical protein [Streptomyces sp. SID11385]
MIGIATGTTTARALADAGADHVIDDLTNPGRLVELFR